MRYCGFLLFFCAVLRFSDLSYAPPRRVRNEKRLQKSEVSFSDGLLTTSLLPLLKLSKIRELNQTRLQRKREPYLKMLPGVSAIISQLFKAITLAKCVLTILELNWNQRFRGKRTKLNICDHILTSSTQLQSRSFHVVERTRRSARCPKMIYARAKRAKLLFFIVKYANLWRSCYLYSPPRPCVL